MAVLTIVVAYKLALVDMWNELKHQAYCKGVYWQEEPTRNSSFQYRKSGNPADTCSMGRP